MEINTKMAHAIGTARSMVAQLKANGADEATVKAVVAAQAKTWNVTADEWATLLASKPASKGGKVSESKETYRAEFDRRTNNFLAAVNSSADSRVADSLKALLEYDSQYQEITGIVQTDRTDFRGLVILSAHPKDTAKLAIYRGGWGDGSKQDRNQYASGRRVPVAKTTGYALEQSLPEHTEANGEAPATPEPQPETPPKKTKKAK